MHLPGVTSYDVSGVMTVFLCSRRCKSSVSLLLSSAVKSSTQHNKLLFELGHILKISHNFKMSYIYIHRFVADVGHDFSV